MENVKEVCYRMNNTKTVLVCVTAQRSSEALVRAGKSLAEKNKAELEVVSVLPVAEGEQRFDPEALENIYRTAKNQGGKMAVYFSDDPILTVAAHIAKRKPLTVVTGFPGKDRNDFISFIRLLVPETPITMVDSEGRLYTMLASQSKIKIPG